MKHPDVCYVLLQSQNNKIGIVKWGENGYYKTDFPEGQDNEFVDELNDRLGVSRDEAEAMMICSMAKPKNWEIHYDMVLKGIQSQAS